MSACQAQVEIDVEASKETAESDNFLQQSIALVHSLADTRLLTNRLMKYVSAANELKTLLAKYLRTSTFTTTDLTGASDPC